MKLLITVLLTFVVTATLVEGQNWLKTFKFRFYWGNGFQDYGPNDLQSVINNPNFNPTMPIVLYFYGRSQSPTTPSVVAIKNAYVNANYNFIIFDVDKIWYDYAHINAITNKVADNVIALYKAGNFASQLSAVGFDIGAQYAGATGRQINSKSTGVYKLWRIIGLEPAKKAIRPKETLSSSDAEFVMTIHTGIAFSDPKILGHAAFFPNGGITQPVCGRYVMRLILDEKTCSHNIVQDYWIEAVASQSDTVFPARKCGDYKDFYNRICDGNSIAYMNPSISSLARGEYQLATFQTSPYSKPTADP